MDRQTNRPGTQDRNVSARGLLGSFALSSARSGTDFDYFPIGGQNYLLPARSESLTCERNRSFGLPQKRNRFYRLRQVRIQHQHLVRRHRKVTTTTSYRAATERERLPEFNLCIPTNSNHCHESGDPATRLTGFDINLNCLTGGVTAVNARTLAVAAMAPFRWPRNTRQIRSSKPPATQPRHTSNLSPITS